jgi:hypothetical protein
MLTIDVNDTFAFGGVTWGMTDSYGCELYFLTLDGWGAPQSTVSVTQKANGDGGFASPAFLQPRVFTATVAVVAPSRPALVAAIDRATGAASLNTQPVTISNGGAVRYALAQRQGEISVKETSDVSVELTFQFVAADPRKFAASLTTATNLPSSSGGLTVPFTVPVVITSTVVTGQCSLTNPGNATGLVSLRVDGPVTGPVITHVGSGASLVFASSYTLPGGNWLTINMDAHTVLENDQADRSTFVTSRGFAGFEPGPNTWTFAASSYSVSSLLTVTATPAWL